MPVSSGIPVLLDGFDIRSGYILAVGKRELDLHNDYDLVEVIHGPTTSACVKFRRTSGAWVDESAPREIVLTFAQVSRFVRKAGNPELAADQKTLSFVGFLHPEDESMDGFLDDLTDPSQDLIIGMEDESALKVHAMRVTVSVNA
jgi:hypothetical protein